MIVAMQAGATEEQIDAVISAMGEAGVDVHRTTGEFQTILAGVGATGALDLTKFEMLPGPRVVRRDRLVRAHGIPVKRCLSALFGVNSGARFAGLRARRGRRPHHER